MASQRGGVGARQIREVSDYLKRVCGVWDEDHAQALAESEQEREADDVWTRASIEFYKDTGGAVFRALME